MWAVRHWSGGPGGPPGAVPARPQMRAGCSQVFTRKSQTQHGFSGLPVLRLAASSLIPDHAYRPFDFTPVRRGARIARGGRPQPPPCGSKAGEQLRHFWNASPCAAGALRQARSMTAAADKTETRVQLPQELLAAFPLPPTHIHLSPSRSSPAIKYEPDHSSRVSRRSHSDSRLPVEPPSPLPQLPSTPLPLARSRATSSHVAELGSGAAGAAAEVVAVQVTAETGAGADASTTPPRGQRAARAVTISASGDMEAADESVSRQVEPGRDSPILVTFRQAGLTPIEPAPPPIGVVYAYNSDIAAGRTRSPSQLSGAAAQRGLEAVMARHHETVQRADSCGSDEAMSGGDSSGSAAAGIKRSGSRIAWLSPRRRSQRARAEREEREVEQAMDGDNEPGAELEQEPFGGEGLEWIRGHNDAQPGGPTHKLPMAPPPTSRLPRMLVKALSGARRSAARRDAGAPPAAAAPTAATRATRASASSARASVDGSVAFGCDCAVASASSRSPPNPNPDPDPDPDPNPNPNPNRNRNPNPNPNPNANPNPTSLPHRAAPHGDGRSRRSHRTSEESDLTTSESADPHPRRAISGPGLDGDSALSAPQASEAAAAAPQLAPTG